MPLLALIFVSALWGSHPIVGKAVEHHMTALPLTVWRFTFSGLCYLPLLGRFRRIVALPKRTKIYLVVASLCVAVFYPLTYYLSLRSLSPVDSLLIVNTSPFFAAGMGWLVFRENLGKRTWLGMAVSFSGVALLLLLSSGHHVSVYGTGLALIAAVAFGGYSAFSRSLFQALPLFDVLAGTTLLGVAFLWLGCLVTGQAPMLVHTLVTLPAHSWLEFLYIALIVSTLAYVLYGYGLAKVSAGVASAVTFYPQALFAALMEWVWFGLRPTLLTLGCAVLILGGTALMRKKSVQAES